MTQRGSFSTTRSLTTHLEQASLCPQGPYPVNWIGSAQTAQYSSMVGTMSRKCLCRQIRVYEKPVHLPLLTLGLRCDNQRATVLSLCQTYIDSMSWYTGQWYCSQPCACKAPFSRFASPHIPRKPVHCCVQPEKSHEHADHQSQQRNTLGRRQAVLSAAAAIVFPTLPFSAHARVDAPPPGVSYS